ncbi:uncharacterized protein LOC124837789 [Vigna umbellata]|uniref:uncharacterized protein LOC124837789 n=1 Tax=Vigna umbellata TaxID=87088 RepID=UPI001F5E3A6E|nr:uncharacterized protein LOC124837789 [Vigna umbellata]
MIIMQTPMLEKNPLVLDKYDGSANPDSHLRIFTSAMMFYTNSDPVICRAFSLSLKDEALECYNTLPLNTEKGETLKAFMKRYTETARQVKEVNHSFIINNLSSCLRPRYFAEKLYVQPPKTMKELQERAVEFIRMEEMRISQRKRQQEADVGESRMDGKRPFDNNDKSGELPRTFKFNHYTTINAPTTKVLEESLNTELLTLQRKPSPKNADERKSCHFHQNYGHTTEECLTLKNEIECLIQTRHLRRYIKETKEAPSGKDICKEVPNGRIGRMNEGGVIVAVSIVVVVVIVNDRFVELSTEERHPKFYYCHI